MKRLLIIFLLATVSLYASEINKANSILESSKKAYAQELENVNSEREKLLEEYALLELMLKEAQSNYEEASKASFSLENTSDELAFFKSNLSNLKRQSEHLNSDIFDLSLGEINKEKLFAFPKRYIAEIPEKANVLQIDLSEGKIFKAKPKTFLEKIKIGGIWIYPICFFGAISLFIVFLKFFEIIRIRTLSKGDLDKFSETMKRWDFDKAKAISKRFSKPYRIMLEELFRDSKLSKNLLEEVSYENMLKVGDNLHRGLGFISVTASIAPLLGLLGTVTGIIKTFSDLSVYGNANPNLLSSGISQALITTEFGLSLAIPAFVLYAYLSRRAKRVLSDMEKLASVFISSTKA